VVTGQGSQVSATQDPGATSSCSSVLRSELARHRCAAIELAFPETSDLTPGTRQVTGYPTLAGRTPWFPFPDSTMGNGS
jgi:hypothetical protein